MGDERIYIFYWVYIFCSNKQKPSEGCFWWDVFTARRWDETRWSSRHLDGCQNFALLKKKKQNGINNNNITVDKIASDNNNNSYDNTRVRFLRSDPYERGCDLWSLFTSCSLSLSMSPSTATIWYCPQVKLDRGREMLAGKHLLPNFNCSAPRVFSICPILNFGMPGSRTTRWKLPAFSSKPMIALLCPVEIDDRARWNVD